MPRRVGRAALTATSLLCAIVGATGSSVAAAEVVDADAGSRQAVPAQVVGAPSEPGRVELAGLTLDVPPEWTVVDLAATPTACVRFDVHAVYLGTPGRVQDCPAVLTGRTEAILMEVAPDTLPYGTVALAAGQVPSISPAQRQAHEIVARIDGTEVLVTATFGTDSATVASVLGTSTLRQDAPSAAGLPGTSTVTALPAELDRSFTWHYGRGFDACTAPALSTMQAWLSSPYRSVGIYIGGASRGCSQANLTSSWVRDVAALGWKAQPIYVGLQAPCSTFTNKITYGQEWTQGRDAALDAIARAQALGIGRGSDIYYDMESYPRGTSCSGSVRAFLSSWTSTLQYNGYSSGVYSSAATGIVDLATGSAQPGFVPPDKIWIARWNGVPDVYAHDPYVADSQWSPYRRMQQYLGGHVETWGGVSVNIDSNVLDTDPNRGSPIGQFEQVTGAASRFTASGWAIDPETVGPIIVQAYVDGSFAAMVWADINRPDVGSAFPAAGPGHGFSVTGSAAPGWHTVCLYAVNTGPGWSATLGCRGVEVRSSDPFGQVDTATVGPRTISTTGWAIDPDVPAPVIVQAYVDGVFATMAWADTPRPDVARVYPAAGPDHGYTLTTTTTPGRHTICLYAVNTGPGTSRSLGCRTITVPDSSPFGQVDTVTSTPGQVTASGWAIDPDTAGPVIVQAYLDGSSHTMAWASQSRPDVGAVYPAAGPHHGYTLTLPASRGTHQMCVYAVNTGPGTSTTLGCRNVTVG